MPCFAVQRSWRVLVFTSLLCLLWTCKVVVKAKQQEKPTHSCVIRRLRSLDNLDKRIYSAASPNKSPPETRLPIQGGRPRGGAKSDFSQPRSNESSTSSHQRRLIVAMVFAALFNDTLQVSLLIPILPSLIRQSGISENAEIAMGIFFAAKDIFQFLGAPAAGWITQVVGCQVALTTSTIGLGVATLVFAQATSFPALLLARSLQGLASAAVLCGGLSLVAESHPSEMRGSAMGLACTGLAMGVLCGPLLGGVLFSHLGQKSTFRLAGAGVLANAAAQILLSRRLAPVLVKERGLSALNSDHLPSHNPFPR